MFELAVYRRISRLKLQRDNPPIWNPDVVLHRNYSILRGMLCFVVLQWPRTAKSGERCSGGLQEGPQGLGTSCMVRPPDRNCSGGSNRGMETAALFASLLECMHIPLPTSFHVTA